MYSEREKLSIPGSPRDINLDIFEEEYESSQSEQASFINDSPIIHRNRHKYEMKSATLSNKKFGEERNKKLPSIDGKVSMQARN